MKKNIALGIAGLAAVPAGVYFAFTFSDNEMGADKSNKDASSLEIAAPIKYIATNEERVTAERDVGEISDELTLITRMVEMSLQKVNIGGENDTPPEIVADSVRRIQMTKGNIFYLEQQVDSIEISRNTKNSAYSYESILDRWLEGNFDNITDETEFLLSLVSKPYGIYDGEKVTEKSRIKEQEYIQRYFEQNN
ncbi:hypothetical protein J6TS1_00150 [Siminovitchia terrae]|uniref:Uncharacterized protein n=1 Tax=Siminovitchia terrae TaxID=1914933 RepID=A0ABQ4KQ59_SIMTE|nr:DUF6241 domain-containing protein [Siminovitchia terrae]GIN90345.1 hypothetical protein J22TS1_13960 [Siminovitchia terrae]GIN94145.1 hypothetical protein J6TS1_00150 [Siminovitchia terrae]